LVDGVEQFQRIGSDAAGGAFVLLPPARRVLFVSSEDQTGIIVADFEEFIQLIVAYTYWHDILKYSANGQSSSDATRRGRAGSNARP
jgi:hypothetical protein